MINSIEKPDKKTSTENFEFEEIRKEYDDFILKNDHPCLMAQTVFSMDKIDLHTYREFGSEKTARQILKDLQNYLDQYDFNSKDFYTFMAVFPEEKISDEQEFEKLLWQQLQLIHNADDQEWDPDVSSDPHNENFSFSILGRAFYIVGLHPASSRKARQSPYPTLTFNLHWQFEKLREMGAYDNVRDKIRERDQELQGSINPMLEDFGKNSEARQYSGRKVGEEWKCPFLNGNL